MSGELIRACALADVVTSISFHTFRPEGYSLTVLSTKT